MVPPTDITASILFSLACWPSCKLLPATVPSSIDHQLDWCQRCRKNAIKWLLGLGFVSPCLLASYAKIGKMKNPLDVDQKAELEAEISMDSRLS